MSSSDASSEDLVLYEKDAHIARLTFNRPAKLNALTREMYGLLEGYMEDARFDDDIKVVILKSNGRAFGAGHDISEQGGGYVTGFGYGSTAIAGDSATQRSSAQRIRLQYDHEVFRRFRYVLLFPKVTIAQVHGYCVGGHRYIAEACDVTIVADDAKISMGAQRLGTSIVGSDLWTVLHLGGPKRARLLNLIGGEISGIEAASCGWASKSVPAADLADETERIAHLVAQQPRDGLAVGKAKRQHDLEQIGAANIGARWLEHTLGTNVEFAEDEYSFFKERHDVGFREAIHKLGDSYTGE